MWRSHECPKDECGVATNVQARMLRGNECLRRMIINYE
jgi:hypothetical protein